MLLYTLTSDCCRKPLARPSAICLRLPLGFKHKSTTTTTNHDPKPPFTSNQPIKYTQAPNPAWQLGDGATTKPLAEQKHIPIDPSDPSRPPSKNYKFLISSIVPRPIALISTKSAPWSPSKSTDTNVDGGGGKLNLAPFSYFQVINHDPPMFIVSFISPGPRSAKSQKDTLRNLQETEECVINVVSEHMLQAVNATAVNAEYGDSEFDISGLTAVYDTDTKTNVPRVLESIVSIEGKLLETREYESRANPDPNPTRGKTTLAIIEGTRFWVREDAIDTTQMDKVDLNVLRPVSRLGGDGYGRTTEVVEIERPAYRS